VTVNLFIRTLKRWRRIFWHVPLRQWRVAGWLLFYWKHWLRFNSSTQCPWYLLICDYYFVYPTNVCKCAFVTAFSVNFLLCSCSESAISIGGFGQCIL